MPEKNLFSYLLDHGFSLARFAPAWVRPSVALGRFGKEYEHRLQTLFFYELLRQGFHRTPWQLVLPGQVAGLIRKVEPLDEGVPTYQYHVRFYDDGTIDCEYEAHNFSLHHFSGKRIVDASLLRQFLEESAFAREVRAEIEKLFDTKEHNWSAIRIHSRLSR